MTHLYQYYDLGPKSPQQANIFDNDIHVYICDIIYFIAESSNTNQGGFAVVLCCPEYMHTHIYPSLSQICLQNRGFWQIFSLESPWFSLETPLKLWSCKHPNPTTTPVRASSAWICHWISLKILWKYSYINTFCQ